MSTSIGGLLKAVIPFVVLLLAGLGVVVVIGHDTAAQTATEVSGGPANPQEIPVKLMVVIYNPIIESRGNQRLSQAMGWSNPDVLTAGLIADFQTNSHGIVKYEVVERVERDEWPLHTNGQRYTDDLYLQETAAGNWTLGPGNYNAIIDDNQIAQKVNAGLVDEVFLWGGPGFGWWESAMAGDGAFWINGGPIGGVASKAFVLMGLNYERGPAEALESYAHRTESIMRRVYGSWESLETHDWNRFTMLEQNVPGRGGIGNAHDAFNARPGIGYDRSSPIIASTSADDWYNFPNMTGSRSDKNCTAWGCDGHQYLKWWYDHMPHVTGVKSGLLNNWWRYIADPNEYKTNWQFVAAADTDFAESNLSEWSCGASVGGTCSLALETGRVKTGSSSIKFETDGGFDTWLSYPATGGANWDLSNVTYFTLWAWAENPNFAFQDFSVQLKNDDGSLFIYGGQPQIMDSARGNWKRVIIPLAGGDSWTRTSEGTPTFADIDQIEIHNDTWDYGFRIYFDGVGFVFPDNDFAENNASAWSCWAQAATCSLTDVTGVVDRVKRGSSSVKFDTTGGFDTWVRYPVVSNANWDLSAMAYLSFWVYAENPNFAFQDFWVRLNNDDGSGFIYSGTPEIMNEAMGKWKKVSIPLAGGANWPRTSVGTPTLADIDQIEIHIDTWDFGFAVYLDWVGFEAEDIISPSASITTPVVGATVSGTVPVTVAASDDQVVFRIDLFIDDQYVGTDAIAPYIFQWDTRPYAHNSLHTITAKSYDLGGNESQSLPVTAAVQDITSPSVSITAPQDGSTVTRNTTVVVNASASDVSPITVEFFVNNLLRCTDSVAPYSCNWRVPAKPEVTYSLQAKATDSAGNNSLHSIQVTSSR